METLKNVYNLPEPELTMVRYDKAKDYQKTSICYQGVLRKNPNKKETIILINSPLSSQAECYEFNLSDITYMDDTNIVTENGESIRMVKLWIRKGSRAIIMKAFEVQSGTEFSGIHK